MSPDALERVGQQLKALATAITPPGSAGINDESGTFVESLTEAVIGVTAGLCRIADAIEDLAMATREASE